MQAYIPSVIIYSYSNFDNFSTNPFSACIYSGLYTQYSFTVTLCDLWKL